MKTQTLFSVLSKTGINTAFRKYYQHDKIAVLMYHGVVKDGCVLTIGNSLHVKESDFDKQMQYLSRYYSVVPISKATLPTSKPKVILTFDDGYRNNYSVAYPILKKYNLPATIFLVTGFIDTDHIAWYDRLTLFLLEMDPKTRSHLIDSFKVHHPYKIERIITDYIKEHFGIEFPSSLSRNDIADTFGYLTTQQIREMAKNGLVNFGSHTHKHELLPHLTNFEVLQTLQKSLKETLKLPNSVPFFCYPNGFNEERHRQICEQTGYRGAVLATDGIWSTQTKPMAIPRKPISRDLSLIGYKSMVSNSLHAIKTMLNKHHPNVTKEGYALLELAGENK